MDRLIPGTPVTEVALLAALPGTTEEVRTRLLALVPMGADRADLSMKLTANVVVLLLASNAKRLGIQHTIQRRPCATVSQQRRMPQGQAVRYWSATR